MKAIELFESKQTLFESYGLKDPYFQHWEKEIHPVLLEVALDPAKITQMFQQIEKSATDAGGNRTAFGKLADVPGKVKDLYFNKLGGALQNSDIVKGFDEKWEKIKSDVGAKYPKLADALSKYKAFADKNPKTQKFLLAVGASVASAVGVSIAGGVGAGALAVGTGAGVATAIVNIADRLLKNEKLSTAVGRGATAGAIAGLAAGLATKLTDMIKSGFETEAINTVTNNRVVRGSFEYNGVWTMTIGKPEDIKAMSTAFRANDWKTFYEILEKTRSPEYLDALKLARETASQAVKNYQATAGVLKDFAQIASAASGAVGTAAAGAGEKNKKESRNFTNRQIQTIIEWCDGTPSILTEAEPADGGEQGEKKPGFFSRLGKNLTTKITSDKLEKAWKKAGSPTDSDQIADVMRKSGVSDEVLAPIFKSLGVDLKPAGQDNSSSNEPNQEPATDDKLAAAKSNTPADVSTIDFKSLQAAVAQLRTRDAKSLLKYIDSLEPASPPKGSYNKDNIDYGLGKQADGTFIFPGQKFDTETGEPIQQKSNKKAGGPAPATKPAAKSTVKITGKTDKKPKIAVAV